MACSIPSFLIFSFFGIKTKEIGHNGYERYHKINNAKQIRSLLFGIASYIEMAHELIELILSIPHS